MIDYCSALQNTCLLLVSHSTLWSNTSKTWANILLHSFRGCVFLISAVFTHRTTLYTNIQIYLPLKKGDNCVFNSLCCVWIRLRAGWLTTWLNGEIIEIMTLGHVSNLAVVFDPQLKFDKHINAVVKSCFFQNSLN